MVTNNGGRDVVINKIAVRGQASAWANVFTLQATTADAGLIADLPYLTAVPANGGTVTGFADTLVTTTNNLILPSGNTMVIYFNSPDSVGLNDIGLTVSIAIHSAQAVYYSETNIQAAPA
jgi:hypothetical protein